MTTNDEEIEAGNIPLDTLREIVDQTINQNPKVFERLAEI